MRREGWLRAVLGLFTLAISPAATAATIELTGRAVDRNSEAVAGAQVFAAASPDDGEFAERLLAGKTGYVVLAETETDATGRYRFALQPGPYTIILRSDEFRPIFSFPISAFEPTTAQTATMTPARDFKIRVLDPDGRPVSGAWVYLDSRNHALARGGLEWFSDWSYGHTDEDGRVQLGGGVDEDRRFNVLVEGFPVATVEPPDDGSEITVHLEAGLAIDVRTVDGRGEPLPSTWLFYYRAPWGRTDKDGKTTLYFDRRQLEQGLKMKAVQGNFRGETTFELPAEWRPGSAPPDIRPIVLVRLESLPMITGTVVDAFNDQPIADAVVWATDMRLHFDRTGADGTFEFPTSDYRLVARAHGYRSRWVAIEDGEAHFALRPLNTARGRVLDPQGQVIEGATVRIRSVPGQARSSYGLPYWARDRATDDESALPEWAKEGATTDEKGRFRLPAPADVSLELTATAPGYGPGYGTLSRPAITDGRGVDIELKWKRSAVGEVVAPTGSPVAAASVILKRPLAADDGTPPLQAPSGEDGHFELDGLGTGEYRLEVSADGFAPLVIPSLEFAEDDSRIDLGRLELEAGERLEGRVTARDGQPLSDVEITATGSRVHWTSGAVPQQATASSDADGRFELDGLVAEQVYDISGRLPGWDGERITTTPEDGPVELRLERQVKVRGRVIDARGHPVHGASVTFHRHHIGLAARTDEDGRFEHRTAPGTYQLVASGETYRPWVRDELNVETGMADLEITLETGLSISGRVLDPSGEPVSGAGLRLRPTSSSASRPADSTDPRGRFFVDGLEAGPLSIEARHPTWGLTSMDVELSESIEDLEIRFPGGVEFSGVVIDAARGDAVADATIQLDRVSSPFVTYRVTTDGDGRFHLSDVGVDNYRLWASRTGFAPTILQVSLTEAGEREIAIELHAGATLRGQIIGAGSPPLARLSLKSHRGDSRPPRLAEHSHYRFHHLSAGEWKLEAQLEDGRTAAEHFAVTESDRDLEINLEFEDDGLAVTGAVLRGEVGVIGATVRALHVGRSGGAKEVSTGGGGHFSLRGLLSGDYAVYVHERGRLIAHRRLRLVSEDHWRIEVSGTKVGGRVLDGGGEPISGADVYLNPAEDRSGYGTSFGKTDREGAFVIPDVAPGRYRLNALAKEHAPGHLHLNVDESDVTGLELLLGETVELVMSPRRSDGSVPSRVVLRLFDGGGRRLHAEVGRPDDGGVVRFRRLKAGLWNATLQDDHNNEMPLRVEIPGDAGAIHMPPSGRLLLNAPELGRDRVALRYRLLDAEGRPYLGTPEFSEWIPPDAQDLRLPAGHWTLEIEAGDGRSWKLPATVADSAETALAIP